LLPAYVTPYYDGFAAVRASESHYASLIGNFPSARGTEYLLIRGQKYEDLALV